MRKLRDKEKMNVIMEAKGYEYIPWNDTRKTIEGPGYYVLETLADKGEVNYPKFQVNPFFDWDFIMETSIKFGCKIDSSKQDSRDKAFDKLYNHCYKRLNRSPENQLDMFPTCACGKNPSCECS